MTTFTENDILQMKQRGSEPEEVAHQFQYFESGFDFADLQAAATIGNGILKISESEKQRLIQQYDTLTEGKTLLKFVPASGAASRMFKEVYGYMEDDSDATSAKAQQLLVNLPRYAFYPSLREAMAADGLCLEDEINRGNHPLVLSYLLTEKGLNYGNKPKAVLKFHQYDGECRTALEEHLVEAAHYARDAQGNCRIHFTVSPQHLPLFQQLVCEVKAKYESRFGVHYLIDFSAQAPSTDTLAATEEGEPFRDSQGKLLFRPGGHGALIQNLNQLRADIVFVKNIDNIFYDSELQDTVTYKKLLAAQLITLQKQIFKYLKTLHTDATKGEQMLPEILQFARNELQIQFREEEKTVEGVFQKLNRPIRICGMVKNEGEPGGGPFWVRNSKGITSLQIVESSQIDKKSERQNAILQGATHFNPVDMVCSFATFDGGYFDLRQYVDPETGFISSKSHEGRPLKAMELPGLWNGAMADWITLFVEVPLTTFHPVKTIFDLQR